MTAHQEAPDAAPRKVKKTCTAPDHASTAAGQQPAVQQLANDR